MSKHSRGDIASPEGHIGKNQKAIVDRKIRYRRWRELYRLSEVMDLIRRVEIAHSSVGLWNPGVEVKSEKHRRSENHPERKTTSGKDRVPGKPCGKEKRGGIGRENYVPKNKD